MNDGRTRDERLGEISGKLDMVLANQEAAAGRYDGLDKRLRTVEQRQFLHTGGAGMLGAIVTYLGTHGVRWPFSS
jgi:hypothetical protein